MTVLVRLGTNGEKRENPRNDAGSRLVPHTGFEPVLPP